MSANPASLLASLLSPRSKELSDAHKAAVLESKQLFDAGAYSEEVHNRHVEEARADYKAAKLQRAGAPNDSLFHVCSPNIPPATLAIPTSSDKKRTRTPKPKRSPVAPTLARPKWPKLPTVPKGHMEPAEADEFLLKYAAAAPHHVYLRDDANEYSLHYVQNEIPCDQLKEAEAPVEIWTKQQTPCECDAGTCVCGDRSLILECSVCRDVPEEDRWKRWRVSPWPRSTARPRT